MMSLSTIRQMSQEQAEVAAKNKQVPYLVEEEDIETLRTQLEEGGLRFPFPNIGDHRPEGYELEGMMMVDSEVQVVCDASHTKLSAEARRGAWS